jgi:DNA gyrase subunit A
VAGIGLKKGDRLIAGALIRAEEADAHHVYVVTDKGFIKRVPLKEYPSKGRGGQGVRTHSPTKAAGNLIAIAFGLTNNGLDLLFENGKRQHFNAESVPEGNRYTQGKPLVSLIEAEAPITGAVSI